MSEITRRRAETEGRRSSRIETDEGGRYVGIPLNGQCSVQETGCGTARISPANLTQAVYLYEDKAARSLGMAARACPKLKSSTKVGGPNGVRPLGSILIASRLRAA